MKYLSDTENHHLKYLILYDIIKLTKIITPRAGKRCPRRVKEKKMRLFFAVNFSEREKDAIMLKVSALKKICPRGNFSRRDNLHVTLAFLGEVPRERLDDVIDAAKSVKFSPFEISVGGAGNFGSVVWLGVGGNELSPLAAAVRAACAAHGINFDAKPFSPHLTICREASFSGGSSPLSLGDTTLFSKRVESFELMESTRIDGVLTYKKLFSKKAE